MSAPVVEGQTFPEYVFQEFPKALYPGGESHDGDGKPHTPVLAMDAEHEAELAEQGLAPLPEAETHDAEGLADHPDTVYADTLCGGQGDDSLSGNASIDGGAAADTLTAGDGADTIEGSEGAAVAEQPMPGAVTDDAKAGKKA